MGKQKEDEEKKDRTALLLQERKKIIYNLVLVVTASIVVVIGLLTMAWFAKNKDSSSNGIGVRVTTTPFVLAACGSNKGPMSYKKTDGVYDSELINDMNGAIRVNEGETYIYGDETYYVANSADTIIWNLSSNNNPKDDGIHPDSSGFFTFYLIPNVDTGFSTDITLRIDGYRARVTKNTEKENSPLANYSGTFQVDNLELIEEGDPEYVAVQYLNRRLLFFGSGSKGSYADFYDEKTISLSYTDDQVTKGVPIPVTIQWIWPKTFAQMACIAAADNITTDEETIGNIRQYIVAEPEQLLSSSIVSRNVALDKMADPVRDEETNAITGYTFNSASAGINLMTLSEGYNVADSMVGKDVKYFLLSITAE